MLIREARRRDVNEIVKLICLWHVDIDKEETKKIFFEILQIKFINFIFIVEEDSKIVGFSRWLLYRHLSFGIKVGQLESIFVHPNYRMRGIGKSLMLFAMKKIRQAGAVEFSIGDVVSSNISALAMYRKLGFIHESIMLGKHKADIEEDEVKEGITY
jgi:ribosomal protein S18 acetylase RimI-like enzyme